MGILTFFFFNLIVSNFNTKSRNFVQYICRIFGENYKLENRFLMIKGFAFLKLLLILRKVCDAISRFFSLYRFVKLFHRRTLSSSPPQRNISIPRIGRTDLLASRGRYTGNRKNIRDIERKCLAGRQPGAGSTKREERKEERKRLPRRGEF